MPEQTIDPIFAPSALNGILSKMRDDDTFGSLREQMQLQGKVNEGAQTAVIILAGGSGERFGHEGGKQLVEIAGKPILTRSAEVFDSVGDVGLIVVVCPEERTSEYLLKAIDPFPFATPIVMAPAGATRQESAFAGLELVPDDFEYVMLHDARAHSFARIGRPYDQRAQRQYRLRWRSGRPSFHRHAQDRRERHHPRNA